jgi:hypothetical protein
MTVYKLVFVSGRHLESYAALAGARVRYRVGRWVTARKPLAERGYHLLVFDSIENLQDFMKMYQLDDTLVHGYLAQADGIIANPPPPALFYKVSKDKYDILPTPGAEWPKGTLMAKRVKLIKRIFGEVT